MTDQELQILKDIENGKYRDCYICYRRKSTDEPDNQKNSLKFQKDEILKFAEREGLKIAKITVSGFFTDGMISEKHSAFKEDDLMIVSDDGTVQFNIDRPKFLRMVKYLNKKLFKGVIILCWDRAGRNQADSTIIKKLIKAGVDVRFVTTIYDKTSAGSLHQDVDGMFAEHHSRNTSEKVTSSTKKNRANGICTYRARVGYLNLGTMDDKPHDPERAPFIVKMFELADDEWSLNDICRSVIEQGFTMPPMRKRRSKQQILLDEEDDEPSKQEKVCHLPRYQTIGAILRSRFYIGMVPDIDGNWIPSKSHKALISKELFDRVQVKLTKKNKSKKYDLPLDHPFRKQFTCNTGKHGYTPYFKKGHLYLGSRCPIGCINLKKSINIDFIQKNISHIVSGLSFTDDEKQQMDNRVRNYLEEVEKKQNNKIEEDSNKKKKLTEDLAYLQANKLTLLKTGAYTPENMVIEERKLETAISNITNIEHVSVEKIQEIVQDVYKLSELLKDLIPLWEFANPYEKQDLLKIMFSELNVYEKTLDYQVTKGLVPIKSRMFSLCARERT